MLDGVTPFPAEFAGRYRELGYWEDRPLFDGFTGAFATYADRTAVIDAGGPVTYRQLDERSAHLARVLLDEGFSVAAIAGLGLILAGSWLAVGGRARRAAAHEAGPPDPSPVQEACAAVQSPAPVAVTARVES